MIKLRHLLTEGIDDKLPSPKLGQYLLKKRTKKLSTWLYHGSPLYGLKKILTEGVTGTEHGEIAEYESFSTSVNSEVIHLFSEGDGETGLQFTIKDASVVILDDYMITLLSALPGSGFEVDVDQEKFAKFCKIFDIPVSRWGDPYLPYGYLSSLGVDAFAYKYTWERHGRGYHGVIGMKVKFASSERG